jgi:hypothetical protein
MHFQYVSYKPGERPEIINVLLFTGRLGLLPQIALLNQSTLLQAFVPPGSRCGVRLLRFLPCLPATVKPLFERIPV